MVSWFLPLPLWALRKIISGPTKLEIRSPMVDTSLSSYCSVNSLKEREREEDGREGERKMEGGTFKLGRKKE